MPTFSNLEPAEPSARDPVGANASQSGDTSFAPPEKSLILRNRYTIVKPLGQGGMGTVFLALDKNLSDRFCVVKKLRLDGLADEDKQKATTFFKREADVLSKLKHPNVVAVQDYFQEHGNYFLVMEYVKGDNLQQLLKKRGGPFSEKQVVLWTLAILDVLHYLHSHNPPVIYRDIKPSNIMLGTVDGIKLVDFGIARPYTENTENTHVVSGGYSPPEQYWGAADPRSDIYALGATMYYLLTGKEPTALQTCSTRQRNRQISEYIDKVIQRATAQDIWLRYQTPIEMRQALIELPEKKIQKNSPPPYVLITAVLAAISVISAAFIFFTVTNKEFQMNKKVPLIAAGHKHMREKSTASWQVPFELASMANNEEAITDPEGLASEQPNKRSRLLKRLRLP